VSLLAFLINRIALFAKFIPQCLIPIARYRAGFLPQDLQALHGVDGLAAVL